ncbi:hypothetical protein D3C78_1300310 [compost metagenome]
MKKTYIFAAVLALFAACNRPSGVAQNNTSAEKKEPLQDTVSSINKIPEIKIKADSVFNLQVPESGDTLKINNYTFGQGKHKVQSDYYARWIGRWSFW